MLATFTAIAVFGLMSLPGWILTSRLIQPVWVYVAAGFCSQALVVLLTAIVAATLPMQMDVRFTLAVAIALAVIAFVSGRDRRWLPPDRSSVWTFAVPLLVTLAAFIITVSAISVGQDGLTVRAWFNADGFKHLAHVYSLANFGLPARDIFGAGGPLAYYWLFYTIPAIGTAFHGDGTPALITSGLVQTFAFWILIHGLLRSAGASDRWAALLALIGWLSPSLDGLAALAQNQWNFVATVTTVNVEGVNRHLLDVSGLFRLSLYIPQHQMMLGGLLAWATLASLPRPVTVGALRWLSLAPLVSAGAVSTLFGLSCLGVFALTRTLDTRIELPRRIGVIIAVGLAALAVPLALGIVVPGGSGLDSPIFASEPSERSAVAGLLLAIPGLVPAFGVSLLGMVGLGSALTRTALPEASRNVLTFAVAATLVGILALLGVALLNNPRLTLEIQLRASLLPSVGLMLGTAWLLHTTAKGLQRLPVKMLVVAVPALLAGLLTPVHDWIWHGASDKRWTITVPPDDLAILMTLKHEAPTGGIVLQYPELPFVSGGKDLWAPILAGRMIYASDRSTDWSAQADRLKQAMDFYGGSGALPEGAYDYVYLSRALHSGTYDTLLANMARAGWAEDLCLPDACLWTRN